MQTAERTQHDMAKVDEIRTRMKASYTEALRALDEGQGDLLRALAIIEEQRALAGSDEAALVDRIFQIADEGIEGIRIRVGRAYEREMKVGLGVAGSLLAALIVGFFSEITLEAIKADVAAVTTNAEG
jgi:hypothetical protein